MDRSITLASLRRCIEEKKDRGKPLPAGETRSPFFFPLLTAPPHNCELVSLGPTDRPETDGEGLLKGYISRYFGGTQRQTRELRSLKSSLKLLRSLARSLARRTSASPAINCDGDEESEEKWLLPTPGALFTPVTLLSF